MPSLKIGSLYSLTEGSKNTLSKGWGSAGAEWRRYKDFNNTILLPFEAILCLLKIEEEKAILMYQNDLVMVNADTFFNWLVEIK